MVNTGAMAVVCALAGSLPASSGFALTPGRFIMPAAPSDGPLPAAEAAVSLLVRVVATCLHEQQLLCMHHFMCQPCICTAVHVHLSMPACLT